MGSGDETRELVHRASRASDAGAVSQLLGRHVGELRAFVRLRMGPPLRARESASDLVQSVCREVLENLGDFEYRGEARFRAWLYTTALNKIRDRGRFHAAERRSPEREVAAVDEDSAMHGLARVYADALRPSQIAMAREELTQLERAFDELSEDHREVISLARIARVPLTDVAAQLGRSHGAVKALLHRALLRLAALLDRPEGS